LSAQTRVMALEADTGKEIWRYDVQAGAASPRGVSYWPGDRQNPARVLFTAGRSLVGLNANTGKIDPGFGKEGTVDMVVPYNGVPTVYKNIVLVGASTGEREDGPPGNSRAYDARTGAKLWEFQSVPRSGQPGHDTWLNDGWKNRSGVNTWGWFMSADEERGIVYMTFGAPAANYYGGDRPGANLYGNSVVAVDAATGKYKWHFQVVHHDLWDTDLPAAPSLFDITKDGRRIPAMAVISKNALMFILNRETGQPIHGVVERPVPKGDAPGEWYSPTQPFPVKPAPLARMSFDKDKDLVTAEDTTPEQAAACKARRQEARSNCQGSAHRTGAAPLRIPLPDTCSLGSTIPRSGAGLRRRWKGAITAAATDHHSRMIAEASRDQVRMADSMLWGCPATNRHGGVSTRSMPTPAISPGRSSLASMNAYPRANKTLVRLALPDPQPPPAACCSPQLTIPASGPSILRPASSSGR
jgi:outer membrane protein assembly factor BamB